MTAYLDLSDMPASALTYFARVTAPPAELEQLRQVVLARRREIDDAYARLAERDAELEALEISLEAAAVEWHDDSEPWDDCEPEVMNEQNNVPEWRG